jgi:hypothetical protein
MAEAGVAPAPADPQPVQVVGTQLAPAASILFLPIAASHLARIQRTPHQRHAPDSTVKNVRACQQAAHRADIVCKPKHAIVVGCALPAATNGCWAVSAGLDLG